LYIEEPNAVIDTTIIDHEGTYYRFTKNEAKSSITMQECTSLSGDWKDVANYNLGSMTGYEGPTIYKLNGKKILLKGNHDARHGNVVVDNQVNSAWYHHQVKGDEPL
jgi:hypothetical protein